MMKARRTIVLGTLLMAFNIAVGAFGAHALKATLMASGRTETFELAVRYSVYHALALIMIGCLMERVPTLRTSVILLVLGVVLFSGSLLTLALTNQTAWGAVTPFGGVFLIAGWLAAGLAVFKHKA